MVGNCPLLNKYLQRCICSRNVDIVYRSNTIRNPIIVAVVEGDISCFVRIVSRNSDTCGPIECKSPYSSSTTGVSVLVVDVAAIVE